jgi:MT0933-like antitoxin protein
MSFLDDAKKKLTGAVTEHGDKIKDGLDKAGQTIDEKTGGKFTDKIEHGTKAAGDALDSLRDDTVGPADPSDPTG